MARYTKGGDVVRVPQINAELEKIEQAFENALSRDGDTPNQMNAPIDMNGNKIVNVQTDITDPNSLVQRADLYTKVEVEALDAQAVSDANAFAVNQDNAVLAAAQAYAEELAGEPVNTVRYVQEELPIGEIISGARWYKPSEGVTYVYYVDEDSSQWVQETVNSFEGTLRDELAATDSDVLVGGVEAKDIAKRSVAFRTFQEFGAVGDGVTDDTSAIQDALSAVDDWIDGGGKTYFITSQAVKSSNVKIRNAKFLLDNPSGRAFLLGGGTLKDTVTLASDALRGRDSINLSDASNVAAGDLLVLTSTRIWQYDVSRNLNAGEIHKVKSVSGNTVSLTSITYDDYDVSEETVTVQVYTPSSNIHLENVEVTRPTAIAGTAISVSRVDSPVFDKVKISNSGSSGISLSFCLDASITDIRLKDNFVAGQGVGYGIQDNACNGTIVNGMHAEGCRRGIDFSGAIPSRNGQLLNFYVKGVETDGSCIGTHGTADNIVFRNGICEKGLIGAQIRSPNTVIDGVTFLKNPTASIVLSYANSCTIKNCVGEPLSSRDSALSKAEMSNYFLIVSPASTYKGDNEILTVEGNKVRCKDSFVRVVPEGGTIERLNLLNNEVILDTNASANNLYFLEATSAAFVSKCRILGNTFEAIPESGGDRLWHNDDITFATSSTNAVQYVPIKPSDIVVWAGGGTISSVSSDAYWFNDGRTSGVRGEVTFTVDVTGSRVRIENVPQKKDSGASGRLDIQGATKRLVSKFPQRDVYLSFDDVTNTTAFDAGTYTFNLSLEWSNRFPFGL